MNTENSMTNEPHRFGLSLADKLNLTDPNKNITLDNLSIYYTWKNIKSTYNNKKFKIFAPNWNNEFSFPNGSYSIADIQDYFWIYHQNHETLAKKTDFTLIKSKRELFSKLELFLKSKVELLSPETIKLLRSTNKMLIKIKMENMYQN